jgi:hypothetical protein
MTAPIPDVSAILLYTSSDMSDFPAEFIAVEHDAENAEAWGAFSETALSEAEAWLANADLAVSEAFAE